MPQFQSRILGVMDNTLDAINTAVGEVNTGVTSVQSEVSDISVAMPSLVGSVTVYATPVDLVNIQGAGAISGIFIDHVVGSNNSYARAEVEIDGVIIGSLLGNVDGHLSIPSIISFNSSFVIRAWRDIGAYSATCSYCVGVKV